MANSPPPAEWVVLCKECMSRVQQRSIEAFCPYASCEIYMYGLCIHQCILCNSHSNGLVQLSKLAPGPVILPHTKGRNATEKGSLSQAQCATEHHAPSRPRLGEVLHVSHATPPDGVNFKPCLHAFIGCPPRRPQRLQPPAAASSGCTSQPLH